MLNNIFLLVIFFTTAPLLFAQNGYRIQYEVQTDIAKRTEILTFNQQDAYYEVNVEIEEKEYIPLSSINKDLDFSAVKSPIIFKSKLIDVIFIAYDNKLIRDSLEVQKWEDYGDEFFMNDQLVQSSKSLFRGTEIHIVYSKEIITDFGPWKFNNVPGLVLKVTTNDNEIVKTWVATSIEKIDSIQIHFVKPKKELLENSISYRDYIEERDNKIAQRNSTALTRLSTEYSNTTVKTNRAGIEKIFEWEILENDKKKN
jgi:GLPGLI family protein